jgi:hypothetical protein
MVTWVINVAMVTLVTTVTNVPLVSVHTSVTMDTLVAKFACLPWLLWLRERAISASLSGNFLSFWTTENVIVE